MSNPQTFLYLFQSLVFHHNDNLFNLKLGFCPVSEQNGSAEYPEEAEAEGAGDEDPDAWA